MRHTTRNRGFSLLFLTLILSAFALSFAVPPAQAQEAGRVQRLTGTLDDYVASEWYLLSGLKAGDVLYVRAEGTSGNLDPLVGVATADIDPTSIGRAFLANVESAIDAGQDPLAVIPGFAERYFEAWDDDSGGGFDAVTQLAVTEDGDYYVMIARSPFTTSFGNYQLLLGVNAADVLTGQARPAGAPFAAPFQIRDGRKSVEEYEFTVSGQRPIRELQLAEMAPGDTLQVFVESTTAGKAPEALLVAFGSKAVRSGEYNADRTQASFDFSFPSGGENYSIEVSACCDESSDWTADLRVLIGRNAPEVLAGAAEVSGDPVTRQPIPVKVGVKLQQITGVDQKSENYGAVYTLRMTWKDPALAFRPDECQCEFQTYYNDDFAQYASRQRIDWPSFVVENQQNNRWVQNKVVTVFPDGSATYFERFTTTLQAPDFQFRQFPFDVQQFYMRVDSVFPVEFFSFVADDGFTEIGTELGEEEWYIIDSQTSTTSGFFSTSQETPRFELRFWARRHLVFYIFRILVPLGLIITVAWITFFLQDFGKRVDVTSANLLLFLAYNFTIANDLPRLGYMTYLDALLVGTFIISVLTLAYNVYLKRQESKGREARARQTDRYMIWLYPLGFLLAFGIVTWIFFVRV